MKLHTTPTQQYQTVTAYDDTGVEINAIRYEHSLLVLPESAVSALTHSATRTAHGWIRLVPLSVCSKS